ncbi:ribonuclease P protein component [[Limnothrix rosea] IAM M-220]|uniref:ribonuclease P protein component n=1 Tax=[Limnothrix rosea] IAM M-220 TaxID=454133 RepID=UPI00096844C9|nr:ribonuclease P protein component [[Limnothrix rosea] IAM M-220]OKH19393.1 ribonuclease P protein component [[Limnothrix rosea] IAM M-220]
MGLPKAHRLKNWRDFRTVYKQGKRFHGQQLVLIVHQTTLAKQPTQIGISISRKVSKKAVVRNKIKRRLRHICRLFLPNMKHHWQVIIIVRSDAAKCEYEDFLRELKQLLIKAEVLYGH